MKNHNTLVIYTRYPEQGRVKTRLIPVLGEQGAASLHSDMTRSILETAVNLASTDGISIEIHHEGASAQQMRHAFGNHFTYIAQQGADLGERMLNSVSHCKGNGANRTVIIGADCPGITESIIRQAFVLLQDKDCVIGPSRDGGYYLIGLTWPIPELFSSIPWGSSSVLSHTLTIVNRLGLRTALLQELTDIDQPKDLNVWEEKVRAKTKPMISVIIPTLNEGDRIKETVKRALQGKNVEVIVVDGGSTDMTRKKAALLGARVLRTKSGRGIQMNEGARNAIGGILLFLHADSHVPEKYDDEVSDLISKPGVTAGAFMLGFDQDSMAMRIIAGGANTRSRFLKMPYGDQGLFLRKDTFLDTGGYPEVQIMEDVLLVQELKSKGHIAISPARVTTSSRRYQEIGPMRTWILNQICMAAFYLQVPLHDLAPLYRSRETSIREWFSLWKKRQKATERMG